MTNSVNQITTQFTMTMKVSKGKAIPVQGCERLRLPHIQTLGLQMAAKLSALRAGRFLLPGRFLVLTSVRG
jgi:hypothetical protein